MSAPERTAAINAPHEIDCGALRESISFFVQCAHRAVCHEWTGHFGEQGLRHIYYCAFVLIGANPGISLVEMARFLSLDKSRASELIDEMEQSQYLVRRRFSSDHRRQGIYLTPSGADRLVGLIHEVSAYDREQREPFSQEELQQLIHLLKRLMR